MKQVGDKRSREELWDYVCSTVQMTRRGEQLMFGARGTSDAIELFNGQRGLETFGAEDSRDVKGPAVCSSDGGEPFWSRRMSEWIARGLAETREGRRPGNHLEMDQKGSLWLLEDLTWSVGE